MTTVTPPIIPPVPAAPAPVPAIAIVPQPPPTLLQLAVGTRLEASVLAAEAAKGQLLLQTAVGQIAVQTALQTAAQLPKDSKLILQVLALAPQVQVSVLGADGRALSLAARTVAPGEATPGPRPPAPATVALTVGTTATATLLRPTAFVAAGTATTVPTSVAVSPAAGAGAGPAGSGAAAPTPTAKPGAPAATSAQGQTQSATPGIVRVAGSASPGGGVPATLEGRAPILPAGTQVAVRIVALQPPAAVATAHLTAPSVAGVALGSTVTGTVTQSAAGQAVIQTPVGPIALAQPGTQPLPPGTQVTLALLGPPTVPDATAADPTPPVLTGRWPALEEALQALREAAPRVHQHLVNSAVPRADSGLAAGIVQFLAALKGGEAGGWLGEATVRLLQRVRPDVAERLEDDFRGLARLANDPDGGEWRVAAIPVAVQQEITQLRLLTRRPREQDDGKDGENARFVVDLSLSRIGRLQLDGLVRRKDKRLDLIVRTDRPLPAAVRDDIRRLFADALEVTGIKGSVGFQAQPSGFVEFLAALPERAAGVTV